MNCPATLWNEPTGLRCVQTGDHAAHSYEASWFPDRHDVEREEDS